eukprot:535246-Pelagomonas_calceolata.AAC.1
MCCCCEAGKLGAPWLVGLGRGQELICDLDRVRLLGGSLEGERVDGLLLFEVSGLLGCILGRVELAGVALFFVCGVLEGFWGCRGSTRCCINFLRGSGGKVWVFLGGECLDGLVNVLCEGVPLFGCNGCFFAFGSCPFAGRVISWI